jgi:hypothetical protein
MKVKHALWAGATDWAAKELCRMLINDGVYIAVEVRTPACTTRVSGTSYRIPREPVLTLTPPWMPTYPPWRADWLGMTKKEKVAAMDEMDRWQREAREWVRAGVEALPAKVRASIGKRRRALNTEK